MSCSNSGRFGSICCAFAVQQVVQQTIQNPQQIEPVEFEYVNRFTFGGVGDVTRALGTAVRRGVERVQTVSAAACFDDEVLHACLVARLHTAH